MIKRFERQMTLRPIRLGFVTLWVDHVSLCLGFPTLKAQTPVQQLI